MSISTFRIDNIVNILLCFILSCCPRSVLQNITEAFAVNVGLFRWPQKVNHFRIIIKSYWKLFNYRLDSPQDIECNRSTRILSVGIKCV